MRARTLHAFLAAVGFLGCASRKPATSTASAKAQSPELATSSSVSSAPPVDSVTPQAPSAPTHLKCIAVGCATGYMVVVKRTNGKPFDAASDYEIAVTADGLATTTRCSWSPAGDRMSCPDVVDRLSAGSTNAKELHVLVMGRAKLVTVTIRSGKATLVSKSFEATYAPQYLGAEGCGVYCWSGGEEVEVP